MPVGYALLFTLFVNTRASAFLFFAQTTWGDSPAGVLISPKTPLAKATFAPFVINLDGGGELYRNPPPPPYPRALVPEGLCCGDREQKHAWKC